MGRMAREMIRRVVSFPRALLLALCLAGVVLIAPSAASAYIRYASPNDGVATLVPIDRIPAYSENSE